MKTFIYIGPNIGVDGGFSSKIWKIERKRNRITRRWGSARVVRNSRGHKKPLPSATLLGNRRDFPTEDAAKKFESKLIQSKVAKGYHPISQYRS